MPQVEVSFALDNRERGEGGCWVGLRKSKRICMRLLFVFIFRMQERAEAAFVTPALWLFK